MHYSLLARPTEPSDLLRVTDPCGASCPVTSIAFPVSEPLRPVLSAHLQVKRNALADESCSLEQNTVVQVSVACGGRDVAVPQ